MANDQHVSEELTGRAAFGAAPGTRSNDRMLKVLEQIGRLNQALVKGAAPWRLLVGARGVGKTTCICKWMAREVLKEGRQVEVMRAGAVAGDGLDLLCEALKVRVRKVQNGDWGNGGFIDVPGIDYRDGAAVRGLGQKVDGGLGASDYETYLVLNAAYEEEVLRRQVEAFSVFTLSGLIFTHVEEAIGGGWKGVAGMMGQRVASVSAGAEAPGVWMKVNDDGSGFAEMDGVLEKVRAARMPGMRTL